MRIFYTKIYTKKIDKLLVPSERIAAEDEIASAPLAWPVIKGTGGVRKARAKCGTSGKSGGIRIIYYYFVRDDSIYMLTSYPKNEKDDLSESDKKALKTILSSLEL